MSVDEPQVSSPIISLSSSNHSNYGGIAREDEIEIGEERISLIPEVDFEGIHLDMGDNREYQPLLGNGMGCMNPRGCDSDEHSFNNFPGKLLFFFPDGLVIFELPRLMEGDDC